VEHSVTEAIWGIDLVKSQILIAQGEKLETLFPERSNMKARGHAIQARIYAEDASKQFAPCPGTLSLVEWPAAVGIRIDTGIRTGSTIGLDYDAMIAKITVYADSRKAAIARMHWCLSHTILFGTITNLNYLQDILAEKKFIEGKVYVKFLESEMASWKNETPEILIEHHNEILACARSSNNAGVSSTNSAFVSPWEKL